MGDHIKPAGWHNWGKVENEATARYVESGNTGPGANAAARVPWARQLPDAEANTYTVESILQGADDWFPLRAK
jgi:pectinesterase